MKSISYYQCLLCLLLPNQSLGWSSLSSASQITTCRSSRTSSTAILVQTKHDTDDDTDDEDTTTSTNNGVDIVFVSRSAAIRNMVTTSLLVIGGSVSATAAAATATAGGLRANFVANAAMEDYNNNKKVSMTALAALRILQRTQTQLSVRLLPVIVTNDYVAVKSALRQPPFDTIRKNASILVENEISATNYQQLQTQYKVLIGALEKIDTTSSLGMRGRSVSTRQFQEQYDALTIALENFLKLSGSSYPTAPPPASPTSPPPSTGIPNGTTPATAPAPATTITTTTSENNNSSNIDSVSSTTTTIEK